MPLSPEMKRCNRLYKEIEDLYRDIDRWAGLSASAFTVLYLLLDLGDGCRQRDICAEAFVSKQTVHSAIRSLEKQGLIRLQRGRGREEHIHFTEAGRRLAEERVLPVMALECGAMEALGEDAGRMLALQERFLEAFRERVRDFLAGQSGEAP